MKSVLMSIQPKWCELIADFKKTVEVRKTKPKLETPFKVYIYCTKGQHEALWRYGCSYYYDTQFPNERPNKVNGKVIGEFICNYIEDFTEFEHGIDALYRHIKLNACIDYDEIYKYLGFEKCGYGWHISELVIYNKPKELSEFKGLRKTKFGYEPIKITRPPQSWCYVEGGDQK